MILLGILLTPHLAEAYNTPMKLSAQIRLAVLVADVSIRHLCNVAGLQRPNVLRFMEGKRGLSVESLDALADVLGLRVMADKSKIKALRQTMPKRGRPAGKKGKA